MKLKELCNVTSSKRIFASQYQGSGIPFYRGKEISLLSNNEKIKEELYISEELYREINKKYGVPKKDDILMTAVGTIGNCYIVKEEKIYFKDGNIIWLRDIDSKKILPKYLYYYLNLHSTKNTIDSLLIGSTQKALTIENFKNIEIDVPNIEIQSKIVKLLNVLNNKIRLNTEVNNKLCELLKNEFRSKYYSTDGEKILLSELVENTISGDWGKETPQGNNNTKVYCVRGADISYMEYGNKGNAPERYILEKNYINKKLEANNIIVEISGGSPTQSTGRTAYITETILNMYDSPLLCTNFCKAMKIKDKKKAPFVYMIFKLQYEDGIFFNWENGTTGIKNFALNDMINHTEVVLPSDDKIEKYYELFNALMNKIAANSKQNQVLEQLRDTMLPKLMNGEIDLYNIEI